MTLLKLSKRFHGFSPDFLADFYWFSSQENLFNLQTDMDSAVISPHNVYKISRSVGPLRQVYMEDCVIDKNGAKPFQFLTFPVFSFVSLIVCLDHSVFPYIHSCV